MRAEHDYAVAPPALLAVLTDEAFLAARAARFGGSAPPTVRRSGDAVEVTIPRQLPVDAVPAAFRPFVGSGALRQVETWTQISEQRAAGSWTTEVGDSPLELHGAQEIAATGSGCRYVITAEVRVNIPFVGGRAESMVRDQLRGLIDREQRFAEEWLAQRP